MTRSVRSQAIQRTIIESESCDRVTIQTHRRGRAGALKLLAEHPPLAADNLSSVHFENSYIGTIAMERRIRRVLTKRALREFQFWWIPVMGICLSIALVLFEVPRWPQIGVVGFIVFLIIGASQPIGILQDVRRTAKSFSRLGEEYALHFGTFAFLWKVPRRVFSVRYALVKSMVEGEGVVVLKLAQSSAICVLPLELLSAENIETLRRSIARNAVIR